MEKDQSLMKIENEWNVDIESRVTDVMQTLAILGIRCANSSCNDEFDEYFDKSTGYDKLVKSEQVVQGREILKQEFIENFSGGENGLSRDEFRYDLNNYRKFYKIKMKSEDDSKEEA